MKRNLAIFGVIFTLLLAALLAANHQRKRTPVYLLRQYPKSDNLGFIIEDHSRPPVSLKIAVFFTDWFDYGTTATNTGCRITTAGKDCTLSAGVPSGPSTSAEVTKTQFAEFDKIAPTLPPSQPNPTLGNLLIVSFKRNNQWTTRVYDRSKLPPAVVKAHQIFGITGFDQPPTSATN